MQKTFKRLTLAATVAALPLAHAYATPAQQTVNSTATIEIVEPLQIVPGNTLNYGVIQKPTTGTSDVKVDGAGAVTVAAGDAEIIDQSAVQPATFSVTSGGNSTLNLTITDAGGATGFAFTDFHFRYGGATTDTDVVSGATTTGLASGSTTLTVGATLEIANSVSSGTQTPGYTVTVDYD